MDKTISRLTALDLEDKNLESVEKQLEEIQLLLSGRKEVYFDLERINVLNFHDLRPDCPLGGFREAGITFRVPGMEQRS